MLPPREPTPDAPCVRNCTLDERDTCLGCGRTLDEILGWHRLDRASKAAVLERAAARRGARLHRTP